MSSLSPFRVPMEIKTNLSIDEAMEELLAVTREPRGFSIMAHRQVTGTVSRDRIVLRRGTMPGWHLSRSYGEFRGNLVEEGGSVRLRGEFVEAEDTRSSSDIVLLLVILSVASVMLLQLTTRAPFAALLGYGVAIFVVLFLGNQHWWRLGPWQRRENVSASAELLSEEIGRILNE